MTDAPALRARREECQRDIIAKGYQSILDGRTTFAKVRTGAKPKAWGHDTKVLEGEPEPLPFKLSEWKPETSA